MDHLLPAVNYKEQKWLISGDLKVVDSPQIGELMKDPMSDKALS